jgi:hypothetical protein
MAPNPKLILALDLWIPRGRAILMKNWTCFAALALTIALMTMGCESDDVGNYCNPETGSVGLNPVGGENPTVEVVRIHRDENCLSFQCLEHLGLSPHCTRSCNLIANEKACNQDSDCPNQGVCIENICNDDDCPAGFACEAPIEVGEFANTQVCVRRTNCESNLDCEGLGSIDCVTLGCFDSCLANENCEMHQLQCEPLSDLNCSCPDEASSCEDAERTCSGETNLEAGSVSTRNVCIVRENSL